MQYSDDDTAATEGQEGWPVVHHYYDADGEWLWSETVPDAPVADLINKIVADAPVTTGRIVKRKRP